MFSLKSQKKFSNLSEFHMASFFFKMADTEDFGTNFTSCLNLDEIV